MREGFEIVGVKLIIDRSTLQTRRKNMREGFEIVGVKLKISNGRKKKDILELLLEKIPRTQIISVDSKEIFLITKDADCLHETEKILKQANLQSIRVHLDNMQCVLTNLLIRDLIIAGII